MMIDWNFIGKWASFWLFLACALIYVYYFLKYYGLLFQSYKTNSQIEHSLFKVVGVFHLLVALQMLFGLYYVLKLNPPMASAHVGYSGLSILIISTLKMFMLKPQYHKAKIEISLILFGFIFLSLHILSRIL